MTIRFTVPYSMPKASSVGCRHTVMGTTRCVRHPCGRGFSDDQQSRLRRKAKNSGHGAVAGGAVGHAARRRLRAVEDFRQPARMLAFPVESATHSSERLGERKDLTGHE